MERPPIEQFVQQGWADHEADSKGVLARIPEGIGLLTESAQLPGLARLLNPCRRGAPR
jgi:hypothetical protein